MDRVTEDGKVACEICKERFKIITGKHLLKHNTTMKKYKEQFPNAKLSGKQYSIIMKNKDSSAFRKEMEDDIIPDDTISEGTITDDIITDNIITDDTNPYIDDSVTDDITPEIEEMTINDLSMEPIPEDKIGKQKGTILNLIRTYFPKTQKDYFIREMSMDNHLRYEFISDYADPVAKILFDFPKAFWHNDSGTNIFRNKRIQESGWKIFTFNSNNPDFNKLKIELEKIY